MSKPNDRDREVAHDFGHDTRDLAQAFCDYREEIESRLAPRPETGGDVRAFMDALWSAFTAKRGDVEAKVLALIQDRDASIIASQGQVDASQSVIIIRRLSNYIAQNDSDINEADIAAIASESKYDTPYTEILLAEAHPQPATGLREALERIAKMKAWRTTKDFRIDDGWTTIGNAPAIARAALAQSGREVE